MGWTNPNRSGIPGSEMKTWPCLKGQRPSLPGSVLLVSRGHPKWSGQQLKPLCRAPEIEEIEETTVLLASLLLVPILSNIVHCGLNLDYEQRSYIAAWKLHLKGWTSTTSCVLRRESLQQKPMASQGSELCLRSLNPIQSPDQTLSEQPLKNQDQTVISRYSRSSKICLWSTKA